jgi:methyl-accepting chemotaxis protein
MTIIQTEPKVTSQIEHTQLNGAFAQMPTPKNSLFGTRHQVSIRVLVVMSFVVPMVTAVGLTGWLSIRHGHRAVNEMVGRLQAEASNRVSTHLDSYLSVPHQLNQINLDAVELETLDLQNFKTLGKYFWRQMKVFNVGYNNYANTKGEFIGVERLDDGKLLINEVSRSSTQGKLYVYETDNRGNRTTLKETKDYDPRTEAWYAEAKKAGQPLWTEIYQWEDKPEVMSISSSYPVYDQNKTFLGVIGIDLILSQISSFLNKLDVSPSAKLFIVEKNGLMVANSGKSRPYTVINGKPQRLQAENSSDPLIGAAARYLKQSVGGCEKIQNSQLLSFNFQGERQFVQVTPWKDKWGLDWRIVVVTSESDFMQQINANTRNTIVLCGLALLVAIALGIVASRWITEPLIRLSQASQAIAGGDLNQTIDVKGLGELGVLEQSFNQMAHQLRESFMALEEIRKGLEERVAERTATIQEESQALQHEVEHLLDIISAVEGGDLTVEAEVSPRVTGLVGDTLNRLVERLGQVMAIVIRAAFRVTQGTEDLEQLAVAVAQSVQEQMQSVERVQTLMEKVNNQAQDAALQAVATGEAVQLTQTAIEQGQQEITAMSQGIQGLQRESANVVKRTETLTNYVELASQFVKDQQRITAMSQILAVNASMLANRAKAQQDPEHMAVITREFEVISGQVNQLATQTKQSLSLLQQRTDQIQTVVSGLNHDVQEISQQVGNFTIGVEQSQQAFNTILSVSERVAHMGQQVTQSSQAIADAAQTTLQLVHYISDISTETFNRAGVTREQTEQMGQLARTLLQNVEFFQLHPEQHPVSDVSEPPVLTLTSALASENHHKQ